MTGELPTPLGAVAAGLAASAGWQLAASFRSGIGSHARLPTPAGRSRARWRGRFAAAGVRLRTAPNLAIWAMAVGLGGLLALAGVPPIPVAVGAYVARVAWRRHRHARQAREMTARQVADVQALRALAAELRSGLAPAAALRIAGATTGPSRAGGIAPVMLEAAAAEALGGDPAAVLSAGAGAGSAAAALGTALRICRRTGARLAAPVSRIADGAAADLRIAREAESALASARSSARLLAALPAAGVMLGALSGTGAPRVLLLTGLGQLCLVLGVALDLAGLAWLDRLARSP
jgi:tight adherence protein B